MITKDRLTKAESNNSNLSVFVDESGDLGFTDKSSSYFVVASVIIEDNEAERTRKEIKRLLKRINTKRKSKISEFKYSRDSRDVKERFFEKIISNNNLDFKTGYVAIDKAAVKNELREKKDRLYNFLVLHYIFDNILQHNPTQITLIIDRSLGKEKINEFNIYAKEKADYLTKRQGMVSKPRINIEHKDSMDEPLLQLADYMAGIFHAKLTNREEFNLIDRYKLIEQRLLFLVTWPKEWRIW